MRCADGTFVRDKVARGKASVFVSFSTGGAGFLAKTGDVPRADAGRLSRNPIRPAASTFKGANPPGADRHCRRKLGKSGLLTA